MKIYLGYDHAEAIAYNVFAHSINRKASKPVSITPIMLSQLKDVFNRERDPKQSNDFAFARFLVPYLNDYEGWAMWADCDMLARDDIAKLWELRDPFKAVQVVKHDYVPRTDKKYLGNDQHPYERKNWSSVILFNCSMCKKLTPEYVNTASGLDLHQFKWLDDDKIGELPPEWNWLVGEYGPNPDAKIVHFTIGGPYFNEYRYCDYADEWERSYYDMVHCEQA